MAGLPELDATDLNDAGGETGVPKTTPPQLTRRGSIAYYLAAWVCGGLFFAVAAFLAAPKNIEFGPNFTERDFFLMCFFVLAYGWPGILWFAFLLRRAAGMQRFEESKGARLRRQPLQLLAIVSAGMLLAQPILAYEVPLSDQTVREAYFLGQRRDEKMAAALAPYMQRLALPNKGPHIAEIELYTPYAQVIQISRDRTLGYSAQQAAEDYKQRGDFIEVRVLILFTPTYPMSMGTSKPGETVMRPDDFWKGFTFRLRQRDHSIEAQNVYGEPQYQGVGEGAGASLIGAQVWIDYDAADVASEPAEVEVATPDGQNVTAKFDLEKLR